jgi:ribosomal protein S18 acetylase RimI-like enzyme
MKSLFAISPARTEDLAAAFRLLFEQLPAEIQETRVAYSLYLVSRGELLQEGVLTARAEHGLVGAVVCVPLQGASGLVWPPRVRDGSTRPAIEDALVQRALAWLRQRGSKLAQALLTPEEVCLAAPLLRNGFAHTTRLHYLCHDLGSGAAGEHPPSLRFVSYAEGNPQLFYQTLLRTYEQTLDCPELNGVRELAEIIEGHKAQGVHDPGRWWLAQQAGQPCGVLLLADIPDLGGWDLSYLGVVPEARGQGIGRALVAKALAEAQAAGIPRLTAAVDVRNRPACQLYFDLGFRITEAREVYLAFFPA